MIQALLGQTQSICWDLVAQFEQLLVKGARLFGFSNRFIHLSQVEHRLDAYLWVEFQGAFQLDNGLVNVSKLGQNVAIDATDIVFVRTWVL